MVWNVELARAIKDFTFDSGFIVLIVFVCLVKVISNKKPFLLLSLLILLMTFLCGRGGVELFSKELLSAAREEKENTLTSRCYLNATNIVVLGGGAVSQEVLSIASLTRVDGAITFAQDLPARSRKYHFIFSGGFDTRTRIAESVVMKNYFLRSIPPQHPGINVYSEEESKNTFENASFVKDLFLKNRLDKKILLITSDLHFLRSAAVFRKQGFSVCSWPVVNPEMFSEGIFNFKNAYLVTKSFNEYFGILGYWLRDWL